MPGSVRGGNSPYRVKRQKLHGFSMTREELEAATKDRLLEIADVELGLLEHVPSNGANSVPLKEDLVEFLAGLEHQTQRS